MPGLRVRGEWVGVGMGSHRTGGAAFIGPPGEEDFSLHHHAVGRHSGAFADVGATFAEHLGLVEDGEGTSFAGEIFVRAR